MRSIVAPLPIRAFVLATVRLSGQPRCARPEWVLASSSTFDARSETMKRMMIRSGRAAAIAATAAVLTATACAGGPREDKAGGTTSPIVLHLANGSSDLSYEPA